MGKKKTSKRNRGYIRRRIRERVSRNGETRLNTDQGKNVKRRHHIKENVPRGGSSQPNHHFLKFGCMNDDPNWALVWLAFGTCEVPSAERQSITGRLIPICIDAARIEFLSERN